MKMRQFHKSLPALLILLTLTGCHTASPSFNFGAYSEAERFYQKGEYGKAVDKYNEYIRENPEGNMAVISYYYMAKSYEALGQADKAQPIYEKIAREHPDLVWAEFSRNELQALLPKSSPPSKES